MLLFLWLLSLGSPLRFLSFFRLDIFFDLLELFFLLLFSFLL